MPSCFPDWRDHRLNLAEKLKAPWRRGKRPDPSLAAAREAARLEQEQGVNAPLGFTVKMMLIGLTGGQVCGEVWGVSAADAGSGTMLVCEALA